MCPQQLAAVPCLGFVELQARLAKRECELRPGTVDNEQQSEPRDAALGGALSSSARPAAGALLTAASAR